MPASVLKRDLKNLIQRNASLNFQAQNGLLSLRSWWRSVRSLEGAEVNQVPGDRIPGVMQPAQSRAEMRDQAEILQIGRRERPTRQVARDQQALLVVNQLRSQAQPRGRALGSRLASAVDPQERQLPANPRHQGTSLALDPKILIGNPSRQGFDRHRSAAETESRQLV